MQSAFAPAIKQKSGALLSHSTLLYLFRLGHWGIAWINSAFWGYAVVMGVHLLFLYSKTYDTYPEGYLPDYANAMVNLSVRFPLWFIGV